MMKQPIGLEKILQNINNLKRGEAASSLVLDQISYNNLLSFSQKLKNKKTEEKVVFAIVRCWCKSEEDLLSLFTRFTKIKKTLKELQAVFLVINVEGDNEGVLPGTLERVNKILLEKDFEFDIILSLLKNYSWTAGLNGPTALVNNICVDLQVNTADILVMNYSFGVEFSDKSINILTENIRNSNYIMSERIESAENIFAELKKKNLAKNIIAKLNVGEGIVSELLPVLGRNTGMIFPLEDLSLLGGFNPICNDMGGMEDHEFEARFIMYNSRKEKELKSSNFEETKKHSDKVRNFLEVLKKRKFIMYHDLDWQSAEPERKKAKEERELEADKQINEYLTSRFNKDKSSDSAILQEEEMDFLFNIVYN